MTRDELLAFLRESAAVAPKAVDVPGWGRVHVRPLTVGEVDAARLQGEPSDGKEFARGVCRVLCDEAGARILDPLNAEHVDLVNRQPWRNLRAVIDAAAAPEADAPGN